MNFRIRADHLLLPYNAKPSLLPMATRLTLWQRFMRQPKRREFGGVLHDYKARAMTRVNARRRGEEVNKELKQKWIGALRS